MTIAEAAVINNVVGKMAEEQHKNVWSKSVTEVLNNGSQPHVLNDLIGQKDDTR